MTPNTQTNKTKETTNQIFKKHQQTKKQQNIEMHESERSTQMFGVRALDKYIMSVAMSATNGVLSQYCMMQHTCCWVLSFLVLMVSSAADGGAEAAFFEAGFYEEAFVPGARFADIASDSSPFVFSDDEALASAVGGAEAVLSGETFVPCERFADIASDDEAFAAAVGGAEAAFVPGERFANIASDDEVFL